MTTEVVLFRLAPGHDLLSPGSVASTTVRETLVPRLRTAGATAVFFGQAVDADGTALLLISWPSKNVHERFAASAAAGAHKATLSSFAATDDDALSFLVSLGPADDTRQVLSGSTVGLQSVAIVRYKSRLTGLDVDPAAGAKCGALAVVSGWSDGKASDGNDICIILAGWPAGDTFPKLVAINNAFEAVLNADGVTGSEIIFAHFHDAGT